MHRQQVSVCVWVVSPVDAKTPPTPLLYVRVWLTQCHLQVWHMYHRAQSCILFYNSRLLQSYRIIVL